MPTSKFQAAFPRRFVDVGQPTRGAQLRREPLADVGRNRGVERVEIELGVRPALVGKLVEKRGPQPLAADEPGRAKQVLFHSGSSTCP